MSHSDKIEKPGYHIRPKYDLHGMRRRRTDDHKGHVAAELPLTAMIDMFSILVIYLLMNFSATGDAFFMSKPGIVLPAAGNAKELMTAPLISFSKGVYYLDVQDPVVKLEDNTENLSQIIYALKQLETQIKAKRPKEFDGRINLQADENTPLLYIKRAMSAATSAGWSSINFVVDNGSKRKN